MRAYVLDSYAVLALINNEPGAAKVEDILHAAEEEDVQVSMSLINLGEIIYLVEHRWGQEKLREMLAYLESSPIEFYEVNLERILNASHIKATHLVPYTDAFTISLCKNIGATLLTGNRELDVVSGYIDIEWLD